MEEIQVLDANVHNLRHVNVTLPRDRLVVFTGVSGSGKSSLAFDTIFAEGQRRYVESLSTYARQFIGQCEKPNVTAIDGLSPAIAIDQKTASNSPRSTVGTVTEIYDYLRVLYARAGTPHCPETGEPLRAQSPQQIVQHILALPAGSKLLILSPVVRGRKGDYNALFQQLRKEGYARVRVDGELLLLDEMEDDFRLARHKTHTIEVVIDRVILTGEPQPTVAEQTAQTPASQSSPSESPAAARRSKRASRNGSGNETSTTSPGNTDPSNTLSQRISTAVQTALKKSDGFVIVQNLEATDPSASEIQYSRHLASASGHVYHEEMAPRLFSFNSPYGACPTCNGLGFLPIVDESRLVPDDQLSLAEGALVPLQQATGRHLKRFLNSLAKQTGLRVNVPYAKLTESERRLILHGPERSEGATEAPTRSTRTAGENESADKPSSTRSTPDVDEEDLLGYWADVVEAFEGIIPALLHRYTDGSPTERRAAAHFMEESVCPDCEGSRLKAFSRQVRVGPWTLPKFCRLSVAEAYEVIGTMAETLDTTQKTIAQQPLYEIEQRLQFLLNVGLDYLNLDRRASTLSGGEAQRIRLATQIGAGLSGVLYVLDEPSIGLHPYNNTQLIQTLCRLRDQGNSLIVVEHDEETIRAADWVVDIGPEAGRHGGQIVAEGPPELFFNGTAHSSQPNGRGNHTVESLTAQYLRRERVMPKRKAPHAGSGHVLRLRGLCKNNLKHIDVDIPLGKMVCVTGLSGSGKSTLVFDILHPAIAAHLQGKPILKDGFETIEGLEHLDKCIDIDQSPIGKSRRSNPATYTGLFDPIRKIFASTSLAKMRGYQPGRFSFNVKGGRCEHCQGEGSIAVAMNFLPDARLHCDYCNGRRYNEETLEVTYQGHPISAILAMTVGEALEVFQDHVGLRKMLQVLADVGLDYIQLGQPANTLSGGEAQRIKLATELCRRSTGKTLYLLDEPTIGLHWHDLAKLVQILHQLVDQGNTVLVIEHNLDLIQAADHIIDLGPEGGARGGLLVATGSPDVVAQNPASYTGQYLAPLLFT
ncbi:MAG: excinuclease ABC subunit UvrA [Candidatus Melainabacteria bacterium]|nr:excinuclease ABC subunit UvrA [Candidatus Melainabacteria bacterium]